MEIKDLITGVNMGPPSYYSWAAPLKQLSVHDNSQKQEILFVDIHGKALIVKEPRPIGFRMENK